MSQALASARKRRAPPNPNPSPLIPNQPPTNNGTNQSGLTLPQVISFIDRRLINLETFVNKQQSENEKNMSNNKPSDYEMNTSVAVDHTEDIVKLNENVNELANEFNARYDILANEILDIKNMLLKLQSFTMDVNKSLIQERFNITTDNIGSTNENNENVLFLLEDPSRTNYNESNVNDDISNQAVPSNSTQPSTPLYNSAELQLNVIY